MGARHEVWRGGRRVPLAEPDIWGLIVERRGDDDGDAPANGGLPAAAQFIGSPLPGIDTYLLAPPVDPGDRGRALEVLRALPGVYAGPVFERRDAWLSVFAPWLFVRFEPGFEPGTPAEAWATVADVLDLDATALSIERFDVAPDTWRLRLPDRIGAGLIDVQDALHAMAGVRYADIDTWGMLRQDADWLEPAQWWHDVIGLANARLRFPFHADPYGGDALVVGILNEGVPCTLVSGTLVAEHPDLGPTPYGDRISAAYDFHASTPYHQGVNRSAHGHRVAGIIAASRDSDGVEGIVSSASVAPAHLSQVISEAQVIGALFWLGAVPTSISLPTFPYPSAGPINWSGHPKDTPTAAFIDALDATFRRGNAGKGCPLIFSAGTTTSESSSVGHLDTVFACGASRYDGTDESYANVSPQEAWLDLVAPVEWDFAVGSAASLWSLDDVGGGRAPTDGSFFKALQSIDATTDTLELDDVHALVPDTMLLLGDPGSTTGRIFDDGRRKTVRFDSVDVANSTVSLVNPVLNGTAPSGTTVYFAAREVALLDGAAAAGATSVETDVALTSPYPESLWIDVTTTATERERLQVDSVSGTTVNLTSGLAYDHASGVQIFTSSQHGTDEFGSTSGATAIISGSAGLLMAASHSISSLEVYDILRETADRSIGVDAEWTFDAMGKRLRSESYGHGRLDLDAAVTETFGPGANLVIEHDRTSTIVQSSPGVWIRRRQDGGTTHQVVWKGLDAWVYVRVENQGGRVMPAGAVVDFWLIDLGTIGFRRPDLDEWIETPASPLAKGAYYLGRETLPAMPPGNVEIFHQRLPVHLQPASTGGWDPWVVCSVEPWTGGPTDVKVPDNTNVGARRFDHAVFFIFPWPWWMPWWFFWRPQPFTPVWP